MLRYATVSFRPRDGGNGDRGRSARIHCISSKTSDSTKRAQPAGGLSCAHACDCAAHGYSCHAVAHCAHGAMRRRTARGSIDGTATWLRHSGSVVLGTRSATQHPMELRCDYGVGAAIRPVPGSRGAPGRRGRLAARQPRAPPHRQAGGEHDQPNRGAASAVSLGTSRRGSDAMRSSNMTRRSFPRPASSSGSIDMRSSGNSLASSTSCA